MTDANQRVLIIVLGIAFVFFVSLLGLLSLSQQPNDLTCDRMISIDDSRELLLLGCEHIRTEGFGNYTVRVIFDDQSTARKLK